MTDPPTGRPSVHARRRVGLFVAYTLVLATATHWPQAPNLIPVAGGDKIFHFLGYAIWAFLVLRSGLLGPKADKAMILCVVIGWVFATADEATQSIPGINRTTDIVDFLADAMGVLAGALLWRAPWPRGSKAGT